MGVPLPRVGSAAALTILTLHLDVGRQAGRTLREARASGREEVFGASTALEKDYLRLTTLPTVENVRPPAVLAQARPAGPCAPSAARRGCPLAFQGSYAALEGFTLPATFTKESH